MNMNDVKEKYKRKNKILFSRDSECLQELLALIRIQKHRTLVVWTFECIKDAVETLNKHYPLDERPQKAVELCRLWAQGEVKMPIAKKAILDIHSMAKDIDNPVDQSLCHAIGQGLSTIHVETHAIGLAIYELTAIVHKYGIDDCEVFVEKRISEYIEILKNCKNEENEHWASFLLDDQDNKEMLLYRKKNENTFYE